MKPERGPLLALVTVALLGLVSLSWAFFRWTATSGFGFFIFLLAVVAFVYAPGRALLRLGRVRASGLDHLALSLSLGMIGGCAFYWICAYAGVRMAVWLWPALGVADWARHRCWRLPRVPAVRWAHAGLAAVVLLGQIPLLVVPVYFRNLARLAGGAMSYYPLADVVLHLGLARELMRSVPGQIPSLPGVPMQYHVGMDLLVALLGTVPGLDVGDLTVRFVPSFFVLLTFLAGFCFGRAFLRHEAGGLLFAALAVLGEDFSFVPGLLLGADQPWVVHFFGAPTIVSLFLLNPMLPALGLLLATLLCLVRALESPSPLRYAILAALHSAALVEFKVFSAPHLMASLGVGAAVYLVVRREVAPLRLLAACLALSAPILLSLLWARAGGMWVRMEAWPYVPAALVRSGLLDTWLGRAVVLHPGQPGLLPAASFWLVALPVYLLGSFGMRALGLPVWLRDLLRARRGGAARFVIAVFVGLGPLISMTWAVTPVGSPPGTEYNNAIWFVVESKYVAWVFAVEMLLGLLRRAPRWLRPLAVSLFVALSVPSTLQYLLFQAEHGEMQRLSSGEVEALRALERRSRSGDVVLATDRLAGAVLALTHCRSQDLSVFAEQVLDPKALAERWAEQSAFWTAWSAGELRRDILARRGARFVLAEGGPGPRGLQPIFQSPDARLYDLSGPAAR
jgi:hypothetical protein